MVLVLQYGIIIAHYCIEIVIGQPYPDIATVEMINFHLYPNIATPIAVQVNVMTGHFGSIIVTNFQHATRIRYP